MRFLSKDTENCTLEYSFQHKPGNLPAQSQQLYFSQPELNNWTKLQGGAEKRENLKLVLAAL
jgi:hypothetical protein